MALLDDVADALAQRTIRLLKDLNDTDLEREVADAMGASSPTLQETYVTAMRIRRAEARALQVIAKAEAADSATPEATAAPEAAATPEGEAPPAKPGTAVIAISPGPNIH